MPPALKNPSQEMLLKLLTAVVTVLGSLLLTIITLAWNSLDRRLANIEDAFHIQEKSIVLLNEQQRHMESVLNRHEFQIAQKIE